MLDQRPGNVYARHFFELEKSWRRIDLEHCRSVVPGDDVDAAVSESDGPRCGNCESGFIQRRIVRLRRSAASGIGTPLPHRSVETCRGYDFAPHDQKTHCAFAARQPALNDDLITNSPERIENCLEVVARRTPYDTDAHT